MHKTGLVPTQFPNGVINFRSLCTGVVSLQKKVVYRRNQFQASKKKKNIYFFHSVLGISSLQFLVIFFHRKVIWFLFWMQVSIFSISEWNYQFQNSVQWGGFSAKEGSISPSSLVSSFVSFFACFNAVGQERFLAIILVKIWLAPLSHKSDCISLIES